MKTKEVMLSEVEVPLHNYNSQCFTAEFCNHQQMSYEQLQFCTEAQRRVSPVCFLNCALY